MEGKDLKTVSQGAATRGVQGTLFPRTNSSGGGGQQVSCLTSSAGFEDPPPDSLNLGPVTGKNMNSTEPTIPRKAAVGGLIFDLG